MMHKHRKVLQEETTAPLKIFKKNSNNDSTDLYKSANLSETFNLKQNTSNQRHTNC